MCLTYLLTFKNFADSQIHLEELIDGDLRFCDRLYFIRFAVNFDDFRLFLSFLCSLLCSDFFFRFRMAEIQKVHEAFSVDRIEEEVKSRTSFLADQQLVHILEECTLQLLQILSIHTVYFLRDIIQFCVERVQVIFTCLDIVVKDLDFLLFFLCKCFV